MELPEAEWTEIEMPITWSHVDNVTAVKKVMSKLCHQLAAVFVAPPEAVDYLGGVKLTYRVEDRQYEHTVYANNISTYFCICPKRLVDLSTITEEWQIFTWSKAFCEEEPSARYFPKLDEALVDVQVFCRERELIWAPKALVNRLGSHHDSEAYACYHCLTRGQVSEIIECCDDGKTALCPKCHVDSLVKGGAVNDDQLKAMQQWWFS